MELKRCRWCDINDPIYVRYHDSEWGRPHRTDRELYELLMLESFQAGLSWRTVLHKREAFARAYDGFDIDKVAEYGEPDEARLAADQGIIRNKRKISASIKNSRIFKDICGEFGSFDAYIRTFTGGEVIRESDPGIVLSTVSDAMSADLYRRGMRFVGSIIIYSYLQAAGYINAHEDGCFLYERS